MKPLTNIFKHPVIVFFMDGVTVTINNLYF